MGVSITQPKPEPEHRCRQGGRCKCRVRGDDGELVGVGVERAGALCHPCEDSAFEAIRRLFGDWCALDAAILEPRGPVDGPDVSKTSEHPIPIPLDVDTLRTAIDNELQRWHNRLTDCDPVPVNPKACVEQCHRIVCSRLGTLVDLPVREYTVNVPLAQGGDDLERWEFDGVDAVLRLAELHRRTQSVLGVADVVQWMRQKCHVCGMKALVLTIAPPTQGATDGTGRKVEPPPADDMVNCRNCHNVWTYDNFVQLNNPMLAA